MVLNPAIPNPPASYSIRRWQLWQNSPTLIAFILLVDAAAVAFGVSGLNSVELNSREVGRALILLIASVAYEEATRRIEATRVRFLDTIRADMTSVWTVAAAIALESFWALVIVVTLRTVMWFAYQREARIKLYRSVYTTSTILLAAWAIDATLKKLHLGHGYIPSGFDAALTVVVAILIYTAVNRTLIVTAGALAVGSFSPRMLIGGWADNAVEFATLSLGGITAILVLGHPWLVILVLAPLAALQRSMLVKQFQDAAMTDSKTGLLSAVAWQQLALRELARAKRDTVPAALLMLDLDHFKSVNDNHGHMAGDAVLKTVADALKSELREYDIVGRFGGEEFVVLLTEADTARAILIAQRLREAIGTSTTRHPDLGDNSAPLTVSVGVATFPAHGFELDELMRAADAALYRAKSMGRDRVVLWSPETGLGITQPA